MHQNTFVVLSRASPQRGRGEGEGAWLLAPTLFGSGLLAVLVIGSEREAHVCRMLVCEVEEMG